MLQQLRASRALQVFCGAALLLVFLGAAVVWQLDAPRRELATARARWEAAPVTHYRMFVRMIGWGGCSQNAVVRHEQIVAVETNTCRYHSPRTVSSLFVEAERFLRGPEFGASCRRGLPGRDCACYAPYTISAEYDATYGYPSRLEVSIGEYRPNRAHVHYWRFLLNKGHEPQCGGPVEPAGRHLVVELFEPQS